MTLRRSEVIAGHRVRVFAPAQPRGAVVYLNGACLVSGGWRRVRALLEPWAQVSIDRPGYHGTAIRALPSLPAEVAALEQIFGALGLARAEHGPVIVVAHSMAAFQAEALLRLRAEAADAVVLVDPSLVGPYARRPLAAKTAWQVARAAMGLRVVEELGRWGVRQALRTQAKDRAHQPGQVWQGAWANAEALRAGAGEWLSYRTQARALWALRRRQGQTRLPQPLLMLEAPPYAGARTRATLEQVWQDCQVRRVAGSGHLMMIDAPGVIAQAVEDLAQRLAAPGANQPHQPDYGQD